jgi:predicted 2-oxoglutarate/Fe(II)-dependent dioxygenase YbiX
VRRHCDQSQFSLTIALNEQAEYEGGGTFFADVAEPQNCDTGGVIAFDGSLVHGGHPVRSGVRYIAVAFLYADMAGGPCQPESSAAI